MTDDLWTWNRTPAAPDAAPGMIRWHVLLLVGGRSMRAECQCGQLYIEIPGAPTAVVACHCVACQRRSGSPFGVLAQFPADQLSIGGHASRYERLTDAGSTFETFFCPDCGSSVYGKAGKHPTLILVAVGAIAEPSLQAPVRSVWEQSMHHWVTIPGDVRHFPKGRG